MAGETPPPSTAEQAEQQEVIQEPQAPETIEASEYVETAMGVSARLQDEFQKRSGQSIQLVQNLPGSESLPEFQKLRKFGLVQALQLGCTRAQENFRLRLEGFGLKDLRGKARETFNLGPAKITIGQEFLIKPEVALPEGFDVEAYKQTIVANVSGAILGLELYSTDPEVTKRKFQFGYEYRGDKLTIIFLGEYKTEEGKDYLKTTISPRVKGKAEVGVPLYFDAQVNFAKKLNVGADMSVSEEEKISFSAFLGTPITENGFLGVNTYVDDQGIYSASLSAIGYF